jgi:sulfite reductase (ferredoxin)
MEPAGGGKPSKLEGIKIASTYLRGPLDDEIRDTATTHITEEASSVLKFHGSYQQDDRDLRLQRKREGAEKAFGFMVRTRVPGGKITAEQYLAQDYLAMNLGNGSLRITTRQEFQTHGVAKANLKAVISRINQVLLSTLAACGDVERNVLCCPAPASDPVRDALRQDAELWASHAAPRTSGYWDIWLDGERIENPLLPPAGPAQVPTPGDDAVEPLYGKTYLPRKFKSAFALPEDN